MHGRLFYGRQCRADYSVARCWHQLYYNKEGSRYRYPAGCNVNCTTLLPCVPSCPNGVTPHMDPLHSGQGRLYRHGVHLKLTAGVPSKSDTPLPDIWLLQGTCSLEGGERLIWTTRLASLVGRLYTNRRSGRGRRARSVDISSGEPTYTYGYLSDESRSECHAPLLESKRGDGIWPVADLVW